MNYDHLSYEDRKKFLVISIKREKNTITRDTVVAASTAVIVGIGALGVYYFGPEVISIMFSNDALTFKSNLFFKLKASGLGISAIMSGVGICKLIEKIGKITSNVRVLKSEENTLAKWESIEKGKSL